MSVIDQLTGELARLPGIGPKTALRLVHHLMKGTKDDTRRLARSLTDLADRIRPCRDCGNSPTSSRNNVPPNASFVRSAPTPGVTGPSCAWSRRHLR